MQSDPQSDSGLSQLLDALHPGSAELAELRDPEQIAERALELTLDLTRSPIAFITLTDPAGSDPEIHSRTAASVAPLPHATVASLAADVAARGAVRVGSDQTTAEHGSYDSTLETVVAVPLRAAGEVIGMIGVANGPAYTEIDERALAISADRVAAAIEIARLRQRRQEMVDALVNLRADLDRSERRRLINEERAHTAERLERAHALAIEALLAVSRHVRSGDSLTQFYRLLTATVAELVGADKVLFWQVNPNQTLTAIPGAYGVDDAFIARLYPAPCDPDGTDLTSQVVYKDLIFRAARDQHEDSPYRAVLDVLQVSNAISVPWRAGDDRLGVVAAYDSHRAEGFSREDAWLLQTAGLAAGLVWQLKQAEGDLSASLKSLQRVDAARELLLKNLATAVDRARRRFAGELHDDALQKLTAAELHLQRVRESVGGAEQPAGFSDAQDLLAQTEEALRKLLSDMQPPALDEPGGFGKTIADRLAQLRSLTGIEAQVELDLPDDPPSEIKSIAFRQFSEALANIEKHAEAKTVRVSLRAEDGGVHGEVVDDGRGFVVSERDHLPGHLGLLALNERALLAGGWCTVTSEPGAGTRVEFWIPVAE